MRPQIDDDALCDAAKRAGRGLVDADLRAGLSAACPQRPRPSRRLQSFAAFRPGHRCVLLYGFPKNERDDVEDDELGRWHEVATAYLQSGPYELEG